MATLSQLIKFVLIVFTAGGDPHFMISVPGMQFPFCFDLDNAGGKIVQLLSSTGNCKCLLSQTAWDD
jgi:hypothetical protein